MSDDTTNDSAPVGRIVVEFSPDDRFDRALGTGGAALRTPLHHPTAAIVADVELTDDVSAVLRDRTALRDLLQR